MKTVAFLLVALVVLGVLVAAFIAISMPVLSIPIVRHAPAVSGMVWIIIVLVPLGLTVKIMRMILVACRRRRR